MFLFRSLPCRAALLAVFAVAPILSVSTAARAAPSEKAKCAIAYEGAQETRADSRLSEAREHLLVCARSLCPSFIQTDCAAWLDEVKEEMPSLVFAATSGAEELFEVKVEMDGEVLAEELDGKPIDVDPGRHKFKFTYNGEVVERQLLVRQGKQNRDISVKFGADEDDAKHAASDKGATGAEDDDAGSDHTVAYIVGSSGLVILGVGAFLGFSANGNKTDLKDTCGATLAGCSDSAVDGVAQELLIADITMGVGVVGIGVGAYLFFTGGSDDGDETSDDAMVKNMRFNVALGESRGFAMFGGAF